MMTVLSTALFDGLAGSGADINIVRSVAFKPIQRTEASLDI